MDADEAVALLRSKYMPIFRGVLPGEDRDLFPVGPPHRNDDRTADCLAGSSGASATVARDDLSVLLARIGSSQKSGLKLA